MQLYRLGIIIMRSLNLVAAKLPIALLCVTLLIAGCSGSSSSDTEPTPAGNSVVNNDQNESPFQDQGSQATTPAFTSVSFDITVPDYSSNALQVSLISNDKSLTAAWVTDEIWTVSDEFSSSSEHPLVITFSDNNGALVLGQVKTQFVTGSNTSQLVTVNADQFNTAQWDNDGDGISNLSELTTGSNPVGADLPNPIQNDLQILPVKTVRISWQATPGAELYRVFENPDGISGFVQIGNDLEPSVSSYDHRIALYSRSNAMFMVQACDAFSCSDSEAQSIVGNLADAIGYFKPSDENFQTFGDSISLSADGMTLAVGSYSDGSGAQGINGNHIAPNPTPHGKSGSVHVFVNSTDGWVQQAYIKASDSTRDLQFGRAVSLSADGNTMAVQAKKVYLFERLNGEWTETAILKGSGKLDLSGNGNTLVATNSSTNDIRILERSGSTWQQQSIVTLVSNSEAVTQWSVSLTPSLSHDGNTLAIGARTFGTYLFERAGNNWEETAYLTASNADVSDNFGGAVSLSADSNTLVVGADHESSFASGVNGFEFDNTKSRSGAAYVFTNNNGNWEQQAYLKAAAPDVGDEFGGAVSISANGDIVAIGAKIERGGSIGINGDENDNSSDRPGAAYVFARNNGSWQQQAYVKASDTDGFAWFSNSISLSADGSALAVGSKYKRVGGAAYLY